VRKTSSTNNEWRKLSPWAVLHFAGVAAKTILNNALAVLPLVFAAYTQGLALVFAIGALVTSIAYSVISYRCFSYSIHSSQIQAKQGLFKRTHLDLVFDRIQNIDIIVPFYFRPLGLVSLKIDGAGSANSEVVLAALKTEEAIAVRESVLNRQATAASVDHDRDEYQPKTDDELLCTRSVADLVRHGMSSNKALIIIAGLGAFTGQAADLFRDLELNLGVDPSMIGGPAWVQVTVFVAALLLIILVLFLLISIAGAILIYYDYHLYATDDGFKARYGLLTHNERTVKIRRIQTLVWQQNWIDRAFRRFNLVFEQISHLPQAAQLGTNHRLIVPSIEPEAAQSLGSRALGGQNNRGSIDPRQLSYRGINWRHFRTNGLLASLLIAVIVGLIGYSAGDAAPLIPSALLIWCLVLALLYRRWRSWGVAYDNDTLVIRAGLFGMNYTLFDVSKLQQIERISTPFTRRARLRHLRFKVASQTITIPYLDVSATTQLINNALHKLESNPVSWM